MLVLLALVHWQTMAPYVIYAIFVRIRHLVCYVVKLYCMALPTWYVLCGKGYYAAQYPFLHNLCQPINTALLEKVPARDG